MNYEWTSLADLREKLMELLSRLHPGQVTRFSLRLDGDTIVLTGEVGSEGCRGDAKRLAFAFDDVFKVKDELVVAGFLEPATDSTGDDFFGDGDGDGDGPAPDGNGDSEGSGSGSGNYRYRPDRIVTKSFEPIGGAGVEYGSFDPDRSPNPGQTEVRRHPMIETVGEFTPNSWIEVAVDLLVEATDRRQAVSLGSFPSDWTEIQITVQAFAPWASETIIKTEMITLTPAKSSGPARFRFQVADDLDADAPALAYFSFLHGSRVCGRASWDLAVPKRSVAEKGEKASAMAKAATAEFKVEPNASGPSLSVSIFADSGGRQHWMWNVRVPGGNWSGSGSIDLGNEAAGFADKLLKSCPDLSPEDFRRTIAGVGERLWEAAPSGFRTGYAEWRQKLDPRFPIQFLTDDPHVPWEMMKPNATDLDHLFLEHPVARWPLSGASTRRYQLPGRVLLSFVPNYAPHKDLPSATAEGSWICSVLGGIAMSATRAALLDVMDGKHPSAVGLIHFAGHGNVDTGINDGGIEMQDKLVGVSDVYQSRVTLGETDGTLVVLNACESSAGATLLGMNTGWGAALAARGFGGLIAPLWEVQDEIALAVVKAALPPLLDGTSSLGEAVANARMASSDLSISAFAYLAHGDVMARFPSRR